MNLFLTSSLCFYKQPKIDPSNHMLQNLAAVLPLSLACLCICSDPNSSEKADYYAAELKAAFENEGYHFSSFSVLDARTEPDASELVRSADLIILMGGHVPTQNAFFHRIHLKELLSDFIGTVIGISAGTMNSASTVYAQPEEDGEAVDPGYQRFLPGLGLTELMILPHYQFYKDLFLDGLRVYEDITYPDSFGRRFYALPDGSYLFGLNGQQWLYGEAWLIENGILQQVLSVGQKQLIQNGCLFGEPSPIL